MDKDWQFFEHGNKYFISGYEVPDARGYCCCSDLHCARLK
jgi:hypothetical protein